MDAKICYVVNSVSETSVPATIATALVDYEDLQVDILAWFESRSFEGDDRVGMITLNAPRSTIGIDWKTHSEACSVCVPSVRYHPGQPQPCWIAGHSHWLPV